MSAFHPLQTSDSTDFAGAFWTNSAWPLFVAAPVPTFRISRALHSKPCVTEDRSVPACRSWRTRCLPTQTCPSALIDNPPGTRTETLSFMTDLRLGARRESIQRDAT